MEELTLEGKKYLSSKQAAKITGYAKDYIGQLCREGRVDARLVGRSWYVLEDSIREHRFGSEPAQQTGVGREGVSATVSDTVSDASTDSIRYTPEAVPEIPLVSREESSVNTKEINVDEQPVAAEHANAEISSMQDAWRAWYFDKEADVVTEAVPAVEEMREESAADQEEKEEEEDKSAQQVPVKTIEVKEISYPRLTARSIDSLVTYHNRDRAQGSVLDVRELRTSASATSKSAAAVREGSQASSSHSDRGSSRRAVVVNARLFGVANAVLVVLAIFLSAAAALSVVSEKSGYGNMLPASVDFLVGTRTYTAQ